MALDRYSRQTLFFGIGEEGQQKLLQSKVLIVGMGALGTVLANHMVRAGVGVVRFVDRDFVEASNLQRQMLFDENDVREGLPKAVAAQQKLKKINSTIQIEGITADLSPLNIDNWAKDVDIILDGTDNFQTRFMMNDYSFKHQIPYVYGGAVSSRGMQAAFIPGETPCLRCFIDDNGGAGETCDTSGVIAPIIDIVASYQATEALKILTGQKQYIRKSLLTIDIWQNQQHEIKFKGSKSGCATCQEKKYPALDVAQEQYVTSLCGRETIQISPRGNRSWDLAQWQERLQKIGKVEKNPFLLRCYIDEYKLVLFPDGRVLIQGTEDPLLAKNLYAKYFGM